jgi:hypothetical protein
VEIDIRASASPLKVRIEPWGDLVTITTGETVRLNLDGDLVESLLFDWPEANTLSLSVPRHAVLTIISQRGDQLGKYDTGDLPPVPDGVRP